MSYVPNNIDIYTAAFAGCISGMTVSGRSLVSQKVGDYVFHIAVAGAWASEFDTVWGRAGYTNFDIEQIQSMSSDAWKDRAAQPQQASYQLNPLNYESIVRSLIALIQGCDAFLVTQGIVPSGVVKGQAGFTTTTVLPDVLPGPVFSLFAGMQLSPKLTGLYLFSFNLQFNIAGADAPQVSSYIFYGPNFAIGGGSQVGTTGGLVFTKGNVPVTYSGIAGATGVSNSTVSNTAAGTMTLNGIGVCRAPPTGKCGFALLAVTNTQSMSSLILCASAIEIQ